MTESLKKYRVTCYNNRRKPWRSVHLTADKGKGLLYSARICLILLVFLESVILFPKYEKDILYYSRFLFSMNQELELETKDHGLNSGKEGESKENGFFLDLKEGKVKLWKKVERSAFLKPD